MTREDLQQFTKVVTKYHAIVAEADLSSFNDRWFIPIEFGQEGVPHDCIEFELLWLKGGRSLDANVDLYKRINTPLERRVFIPIAYLKHPELLETLEETVKVERDRQNKLREEHEAKRARWCEFDNEQGRLKRKAEFIELTKEEKAFCARRMLPPGYYEKKSCLTYVDPYRSDLREKKDD